MDTIMVLMKENTADSSTCSAGAGWGGFLAIAGLEGLDGVSAKGAAGCSMQGT